MNRIDRLFSTKSNNLLSVYFTAGFPRLNDTTTIIRELAAAGVDMIEVGIPFSDPLADGVVIQGSSSVALRNGMSLRLLLEQVAEVRDQVPDTPLIAMGYLNPIMQFGIEAFFKRCKEVGIDALIVPDLPFEEYLADFKALCRSYDIPIIMLITPETSAERIHLIDDNCDGFTYMVSAASTTGTRDRFGDDQLAYFARINAMELRHRRLIGFGISNPATFRAACDNSSGAIIGSFFIKCLQSEPDIKSAVARLVTTVRG